MQVNDTLDAEKPLILTPYVESGQVAEGRRLARVSLADHLGIRSYAGYFTVNKTYNSNQFFWYFPPTAADEKTAPVVLWLQGGPGASSLCGLFVENGPIQVINDTIIKREYHWAVSHHLVYIDNPIGAGFSFTEDETGYCSEEECVGAELYSTVVQFLQLFPALQTNELFIAGESYAGKFVPALALTIHARNPHASLKINLQGLAIGDGFSDPVHQLDYGQFLYQLGLVDWNQLDVYERTTAATVNAIKEEDWTGAIMGFNRLKDLYKEYTGLNYYDDFLHSQDFLNKDYELLLQKKGARKKIHVGNRSFESFRKSVYDKFLNDLMKSVAPLISELLDYYDVLVYNGQLDVFVAYPLTRNYLLHLNFSDAAEYKTARRHIWRVDGEVAGYVKRAGRLVEAMVRNAGHMVPAGQPRWAQDLITRFTHNQPFYTDSDV